MLDLLCLMGLFIIFSMPVTVYLLDRWGFEEVDHLRAGEIEETKSRQQHYMERLINVLTIIGFAALLVLPISVYMIDH